MATEAQTNARKSPSQADNFMVKLDWFVGLWAMAAKTAEGETCPESEGRHCAENTGARQTLIFS